MNPRISICVPVHDMENKAFFLNRLLTSLWEQTMQDFEIIVSDNSEDDVLGEVCDYYKTGITYYKNPVKGMAQNTNAAIKKANAPIVKILYLDDYLAHKDALRRIYTNLEGQWLVSGCTHDDNGILGNEHYPSYNHDITKGNNTIGSPSVLTFRQNPEYPILFDENMTWLLDCDLYYRLHELYGDPVFLNEINVVIGVGKHQATHLIPSEIKAGEHDYLTKKYE